MEWTKEGYVISMDKKKLDLDMIHGYLKGSYWASHRSKDLVTKSIETSLCFGVFEKDQQIGFGRVISDKACTSYVCDVFILPECQGKGLGTWLMECIVSHPELKGTNFLLATKDAHELYEKLGFKRAELMSKSRSR